MILTEERWVIQFRDGGFLLSLDPSKQGIVPDPLNLDHAHLFKTQSQAVQYLKDRNLSGFSIPVEFQFERTTNFIRGIGVVFKQK